MDHESAKRRKHERVMVWALAAVVVLVWAALAEARRVHPERWYQARWCAERGGRAEVVMSDGTRCDCVTAEYAIEFDFADKWAESLGQALHYGAMSGKRAGIVLIVEGEGDRKYVDILRETIDRFLLPVDVWILTQ